MLAVAVVRARRAAAAAARVAESSSKRLAWHLRGHSHRRQWRWGQPPDATTGEDGQLSGQAAEGGTGCTQDPTLGFGDGGSGGACRRLRHPAKTQSRPESSALVFAGAGGGAVGRIRINVTLPEDFSAAGIVSPEPDVWRPRDSLAAVLHAERTLHSMWRGMPSLAVLSS